MTNMIIDDDIQHLKKRIKKLNFKIDRACAIGACINLMNKYQYFSMRGMHTEATQLFALKSAEASIEMPCGIYDEPEGVLRWRKSEGFGKSKKEVRKNFKLHCMTTPVIEIAGDGQTAKGFWLMIGTETKKHSEKEKTSANWVAGYHAMDFIKEDNEWKIWRYSATEMINAPFEKGWETANKTQEEVEKEIEAAFNTIEDQRPDRPPSYSFIAKGNEILHNIPPVPEPYETWDDALACIPPPGKKWNINKL